MPPIVPFDVQIESQCVYGIGYTWVRCCDENFCQHDVALEKHCMGMSLAVGVGMSLLMNINGKNCPLGYEGLFLESAAGFCVQLMFEVSLNPWNLSVADDPVVGVGLSIGLSPFPIRVRICQYWILNDRVTGVCGKWRFPSPGCFSK